MEKRTLSEEFSKMTTLQKTLFILILTALVAASGWLLLDIIRMWL
jgi:hypothetical protein